MEKRKNKAFEKLVQVSGSVIAALDGVLDSIWEMRTLESDCGGYNGQSMYESDVYADETTAVGMLIEHGADASQLRLAVMRACTSHCPRLVKYVIDGGGDIHECNEKGETALFDARAPEDAIRYLVHCGANVNHQSKDGSTALLKLCRYGKQVDSEGADEGLIDLETVKIFVYFGVFWCILLQKSIWQTRTAKFPFKFKLRSQEIFVTL